MVLPDAYCIHFWETGERKEVKRPQMTGHASLYQEIETNLRSVYNCPINSSFCPTDNTKFLDIYGKYIPMVQGE